MKLHERHIPFTRAGIELLEARMLIEQKYQLTAAEILSLLARETLSVCNSSLRAERLPEGWVSALSEINNTKLELSIREEGDGWKLYHLGVATAHQFNTLAEALDHAEDVIHNAH